MAGWDGIDEFVAVYERGSFSAAAIALGVSASHVSRSVAALEDRLKAKLFQRTTRTVIATDVAKAFAQRCRALIEDRDDALAAASEHGVPTGTLRITCSIAFGEQRIAPLLRDFLAEHRAVNAVLDLNNHVVDIVAEGYDLAIRSGWLSDSGLVGVRVSSRELLLCASPAYLMRAGRPADLAAVADHECLIGSNEVWHFETGGKPIDLRPRGRFRCNSGYAVTQAAVAGLGLCQLPEFYVRQHIASGALVPLLTHLTPPQEPVWAVYPDRHHLQSRVRLFVDLLKQRLGAS
jgi:DNA-binding transcriptional LysR family regulator